jgi:hypothetical protein
LGSSAADVLFAKGNIYVEGPHDQLILQTGYAELLNGYKITSVGGRGEIEREIPNLQEQEKAGKLTKRQLFILDGDRRATTLSSTRLVRIHQLKRYCIENFLLNENIVFDLVTSHAKKPVESRGQFPATLKELALAQTREVAIWETYVAKNLQPKGLRREQFADKEAKHVATEIANDLAESSQRLNGFDPKSWIDEFVNAADVRERELRQLWASNWKEPCNGKTLIDALYVRYEIAMKKTEFKKEIIRRMAAEKSDDWRILNDVLMTELQERK